MQYERIKDIAIATAYFQTLYTHQSFFNSIDYCFDLAVEFVEKYPPETEWGIELEYEETLEKFFMYKEKVLGIYRDSFVNPFDLSEVKRDAKENEYSIHSMLSAEIRHRYNCDRDVSKEAASLILKNNGYK